MRHLSILLWIFVFSTSSWAQPSDLISASCDKRVVFLGESHTSELDHQGQLQALELLFRAYDIHVVAEMFNPLGQTQLEAYRDAGAFEDFEEDFWQEQWGHPYELYRPIFSWVKTHDVSLTHLRPDPAFTRKVKEKGPAAAIEMLGEFFLGPTAYREFMENVAKDHMSEGIQVPESMVDAYFLVQCFWDEYMSWRIVQEAQQNPNKLVVVLVGHGHLHPNFGIPPRLNRRAPELTSLRVGFQEEAEWGPDFVLRP